MASEEQSSLYLVTARKWRPQQFEDVVGQEHVTRTLRNAVLSGRIHHAYIFNGPRGVGKTTTARILAKAVNCQQPLADSEPCNSCASCEEINSGRSLDVIEIDGASNNSVDDIRKLRENAKYPPVKGAYKMYIIDEIHMLSTSAFNALLKTLEEPPRHLLFVFATTEPHKVPATILSRCQRFDFRRMQVDEISAQLRHIADKEGISIDDESLAIIGKKGDGSMRDSQSIFDQVIAFCGQHVEYSRVNEALNLIDQEFYFTLGEALREHDVATVLNIAREVFVRGYDIHECLNGLAEHFRNILTVLATGDTQLIEASKIHREQYKEIAMLYRQADVLQSMNIIISTERELRYAPQPRLRFEFALVHLAKMDSAVQIAELLQEIQQLKKKVPHNTVIPQQPQTQLGEAHATNTSKQTLTQPLTIKTSEPRADYAPASISLSKEQTTSTAGELFTPNSDDKHSESPVESLFTPEPYATELVDVQTFAEQWLQRLSTVENLEPIFRKYIVEGVLTKIYCEQYGLIVHSDSTSVADLLLEKSHILAEILSQLFQTPVTITVTGGNKSPGTLFGEFVQQPSGTQISGNEILQTPEIHSADTNNKSENDAKTIVENPISSDSAEPDLHELDRTIINLFGASEIPIRSHV